MNDPLPLPSVEPTERRLPPLTAEERKELEREQVEWDKLHRGEINELPEWLKARLGGGME
ncbi:MAG TPA: hypothetical protein PLB55_04105 [Prosthecobacter sp.]|nr:hypothetical protein [Prosthecobacter sp.]